MSKILVSSQGPSLDDQVDPRFGRAAYFIVVDPETLEFEVIDNSAGRAAAQGAGIQAAETVVNAGAKVVLSGFIGPRAYEGLAAAGIQIGQGVEGLTVKEAVQRYRDGQVDMASQATKPGHWG